MLLRGLVLGPAPLQVYAWQLRITPPMSFASLLLKRAIRFRGKGALMFEIGFSEIILVAIVALLVFGPDKLPGLARDIGLWTGRIRRMINSVQQDVQRELSRADELKRLVEEQQNILDRHIIIDDTTPAVPITGKPVSTPTPTPTTTPATEAPFQPALSAKVADAPVVLTPGVTQPNPEPIPEQHALPLGAPVDVQTKQTNK